MYYLAPAMNSSLNGPRAYEISNFHGKEPPPKEILEDVTAKGGNLLTRTKENFLASSNRELESLTNGQNKDSDSSDDESERTPKEDKMDIDEAPGSTGRVTRGECPQTRASCLDGRPCFNSPTTPSLARESAWSTFEAEVLTPPPPHSPSPGPATTSSFPTRSVHETNALLRPAQLSHARFLLSDQRIVRLRR